MILIGLVRQANIYMPSITAVCSNKHQIHRLVDQDILKISSRRLYGELDPGVESTYCVQIAGGAQFVEVSVTLAQLLLVINVPASSCWLEGTASTMDQVVNYFSLQITVTPLRVGWPLEMIPGAHRFCSGCIKLLIPLAAKWVHMNTKLAQTGSAVWYSALQ